MALRDVYLSTDTRHRTLGASVCPDERDQPPCTLSLQVEDRELLNAAVQEEALGYVIAEHPQDAQSLLRWFYPVPPNPGFLPH